MASSLQRGTASLPRILARYYRSFSSSSSSSSSSSTSSSTSSSSSSPPATKAADKAKVLHTKVDLEGAKAAEDAAKFATAFMFPWEKRALDDSGKKGLSNIEKGYWIVFSGKKLLKRKKKKSFFFFFPSTHFLIELSVFVFVCFVRCYVLLCGEVVHEQVQARDKRRRLGRDDLWRRR